MSDDTASACSRSESNARTGSFELGDSTGRMPEAQDVDGLSFVVRLTDDAIGSQNDLSYGFIRFLRNGTVGKGEFGGSFEVVHNALGEMGGSDRIVQGDESDDLLEIVDRLQGPGYPASHCLRLSLTSSWGTTRPALISARPMSIPLRKRTRSSMSSHVAESGSSWMVLMAKSLLVILLAYPFPARQARQFARIRGGRLRTLQD